MLQGLRSMGPAELTEIAKLTGLQDDKDAPSMILAKILSWLGKIAGAAGNTPEAIERATLEFVARNWGLQFDPTWPTDELERALRVKIAGDAAEYLGPSWNLACVFAATGPVDAVPPKLRLLEKAASLAVPSRKARAQLMEEWRQNCKRWAKINIDEALRELKLHFETPERAELALNLSLVVALADGRLSMEEERLFKKLYEQSNKTPQEATEALRRVSAMFWDQQAKAAPKSAADDAQADKIAALKAAEMTLAMPGMLEGFVLEASDKIAGPMEKTEVVPKSGWQRILGAFSGFSQYVATRVTTNEQAVVTRTVYLSILRQHAQVVAEVEAAERAAAEADRHKVQAEAQKQIASEVGMGSTTHAQRVVKLDPL